MPARYSSFNRSVSWIIFQACIFALYYSLTSFSYAGDNAVNEKTTQKIVQLPAQGFVWPNQTPQDCPFAQSKQLGGVYFTGTYHTRNYGDTWYPSWASDGNLYSPFADGTTEGETAICIEDDNYKLPRTGNAVMIGDDPQNLIVKNTCPPQVGSPKPFEGRYPCGTLVYNGVWYYGTYCLGPHTHTMHENLNYMWPIMGPMPGFRISTDYGKTWTPSPLSPDKPLFPEPAKRWGPVKMGSPHFVDFGKNMEHSPDGKAYLVGQGAEENDPQPRYANLNWGAADQIYLTRVTPSIENINDIKKYEFFAGHDSKGNPQWTGDFAKIKPLLDWNNKLGCATVTYDAPLKKYLMCVSDCWPTYAKMHTYILEADAITGPWRMVTYMQNFGEQAYFVNIPSKFISPDGKTFWLCYSANFCDGYNGEPSLKANPPGSGYGLCWQEVRLLAPGEPAPKSQPNPLLAENNIARKAKVEVSSCFPGYNGEGATDGVVDGYPTDITKEWAANAEAAGAWIKQSWDKAQKIDRILLFDRPTTLDQLTGGTLEFSDGSTIKLEKPLPDTAAESLEISFTPKSVKWVKLTVSDVKNGTHNVGLAEFGVFGSESPNQASEPSKPLASSRVVPAEEIKIYSDKRPAAKFRLNAEDQGVVLRHGDGPEQCDRLGARDVWIYQAEGTYYMHYDAAGPKGWLCALATSKDLVHWTKKGTVLELGKPGEDDSASASYGTTYFDGKSWHMFYLGTPNSSPAPDLIPICPYLTRKAKSASPSGPWIKQKEVIPLQPKPNSYYWLAASPGQVIKQGDEYLMFFNSGSLGIARTKNLDGSWTPDEKPILPADQRIENTSLYFEDANKTWFLFTNHIGVDARDEYTDAIWVYWTQDLYHWNADNKAIVLDGSNCKWSTDCIGLPSVVQVGRRLAVFYDAPGGKSVSHMHRDVGLAWLNLPLELPARTETEKKPEEIKP
jgi:predicted GH43/DUF377 family glycosyl hydrolase